MQKFVTQAQLWGRAKSFMKQHQYVYIKMYSRKYGFITQKYTNIDDVMRDLVKQKMQSNGKAFIAEMRSKKHTYINTEYSL